MALVRTARGTDPRRVADAAASAAAFALERPDARFWAQRALRPFVPGTAELDGNGLWYAKALGQWAQSVAPMREPAKFGEIVQAPWRTIAYRMGDCDDVAAAVAFCAAIVSMPTAVAVYPLGAGMAHCVAILGPDWRGDGDSKPLPLEVLPQGTAILPVLQVDQAHGLQPFNPPTIPYIARLKK